MSVHLTEWSKPILRRLMELGEWPEAAVVELYSEDVNRLQVQAREKKTVEAVMRALSPFAVDRDWKQAYKPQPGWWEFDNVFICEGKQIKVHVYACRDWKPKVCPTCQQASV